jgi:GntR family transcriptional regulator
MIWAGTWRSAMSGQQLVESAFRRVARELRTQILDSDLAANVPLPTEADLAERYGVSRQTIRRAFQDLVAEGLVHRVPGRGTFAVPPSERYLRQLGSVEDLIALSTDSELRVLVPLCDTVDPAAASRLRLPDDHVVVASFLRQHSGGQAFCHTRLHLPPDVRRSMGEVPELSTLGAVSRVTVVGLLDQVLPTPITTAEQSITTGTAPPDVAEALEVPAGATLLRIDRTYWDADGRPVELTISYFHPERYSYRVRLRRSLR